MKLFRISQVSLSGIHIEEKPFVCLEAAQVWAAEEARSNGAIHHGVADLGDAFKLKVQVTDTFGGEANYSWVRNYEVWICKGTPRKTQIRKVKAEAGWTGIRCETTDHGDMIEMRPRNMAQVMFVTEEYYN